MSFSIGGIFLSTGYKLAPINTTTNTSIIKEVFFLMPVLLVVNEI